MTSGNTEYITDIVLQQLFLGINIQDKPDVQQLVKQQFDIDYQKLPITIPLNTYQALMEFIRQKLYSDKSFDEGYIKIGMALSRGHVQSSQGVVNRMAVKMLGPERSIEVFLQALQAARPGKVFNTVEQIQPGYLRYRADQQFAPPALLAGILKGYLILAGAQNITITWQRPQPDASVYELTWD